MDKIGKYAKKNRLCKGELITKATLYNAKDSGYTYQEAFEFIHQHENTCGMHEVFLIKKDSGIGNSYVLLCPNCEARLDITDISCW